MVGRKRVYMFKFGTGGWRAVIGDGFNKQNIQLLAYAVKTMLEKENCQTPLVIGYDRRFLSKEAVKWFAEVFLHDSKLQLWFINHSVPTPVVMHYTKQENFDYGMMVTASHNLAIYNGFKLFTKGGKDADLAVTERVQKIAEDLVAKSAPNWPEIAYTPYEDLLRMRRVKEFYPINDYLDSIERQIDMDAIKQASLKLIFDPMYGASGEALKSLLLSARCQLEVIHHEHDTLFGGHMPSPSEERLGIMRAIMQEHRFNAGIATDGDGDRLAIIDDKCRYLSANEILSLVYYYFLEYKHLHGPVVRNLATTHLLDKIAEHYGETAVEVKVGFKWVSAAMKEYHAILGGESSGGLALPSHINGKDGVFAAMLVIEMMAVSGKPISVLLDEVTEKFSKFHMLERERRFREDQVATIKAELEKLDTVETLPNYDVRVRKIRKDDGLKLTFVDDSFVLLRFSGTEPVLRVFAESDKKEKTEELIERCYDLLRLKGIEI